MGVDLSGGELKQRVQIWITAKNMVVITMREMDKWRGWVDISLGRKSVLSLIMLNLSSARTLSGGNVWKVEEDRSGLEWLGRGCWMQGSQALGPGIPPSDHSMPWPWASCTDLSSSSSIFICKMVALCFCHKGLRKLSGIIQCPSQHFNCHTMWKFCLVCVTFMLPFK